MAYAERVLLVFRDLAVAGGFLLFLQPVPLYARVPSAIWPRCCRNGRSFTIPSFQPDGALTPRSRGAKKVLSLASWSGHRLSHRPSHTDRPLRKPLLCVHDSRRPVCLVAVGLFFGCRNASPSGFLPRMQQVHDGGCGVRGGRFIRSPLYDMWLPRPRQDFA